MLDLIVPVTIKSKPTGHIGRGKNLYQNSAEYVQFKRQSLKYLSQQKVSVTLTKIAGIVICGFVEKPRTRSKDTGQMQGAIYDILVTAKILKDDNMRVFPRSLNYFFFDNMVQGYWIRLCKTKKEWNDSLFTTDEAMAKSKVIEAYSLVNILNDIEQLV